MNESKTGTFVGKGKGFKDDIVLDVTTVNGEMEKVALVSSDESPDIGEKALPLLIAAANEQRQFEVDGISGASHTSDGFNTAIDQAGGDPEAFANRTLPVHESKHQDLHTDIIAIGAGLAGFSAALEAAQNGASVMLLEAGQTYSSSTTRAQGFIMGAATNEQKRRGITDSADHFYQDLMTVYGDEPNIEPKLLRKLADESADYIKFLENQGLKWDKVVNIAPKEPWLMKIINMY